MNSTALFSKTPPLKLFFLASIPGAISMLASALYQTLDGVFVGRFLGETAFAALNLAMPFVIINFSLADLIGVGSSVPIEMCIRDSLITGLIVIFFGLNFLGVFRLHLFRGAKGAQTDKLGFFSSVLFGAVFSVGWTPCVGAFLGSALMLATSRGNVLEGVLMLLFYSLGLGIPFFFSAVLIDRLKGAFSFIKNHYRIINLVSGVFLVIVGVLMATGLFGKFLTLLS